MSERKVLLLAQPPAGPVPTAEELAQAVDLSTYFVHNDVEWTGNVRVEYPKRVQP